VSENTQILKVIGVVSEATQGRGIIAIDRGGDRYKLFNPFLDKGLRFVIRQKGDRHVVLSGGRTVSVQEAARWCRTSVRYRIEVEREGHTETKTIRAGSLEVRLSKRRDDVLWLVVVRGFGEKPIFLLTNVAPSARRGDHAKWIADIYVTRWCCEEVFRFMNQTYQLENVRVRSYTELRTTYVLVHAVTYFVSVVVGSGARLRFLFQTICQKAQRFFEIARFCHYAVADGIHRVLFASAAPPHVTAPTSGPIQHRFAFELPPP